MRSDDGEGPAQRSSHQPTAFHKSHSFDSIPVIDLDGSGQNPIPEEIDRTPEPVRYDKTDHPDLTSGCHLLHAALGLRLPEIRLHVVEGYPSQGNCGLSLFVAVSGRLCV